MDNIFKSLCETIDEGVFLPTLIPDFIENLESDIISFDIADKPLNKKETFVSPHYVEGYTKSNGTEVDGYWRDGDGDTSVDLSKEDGGGYFRKL